MATIRSQLARLGIDLIELLQRVKAFEDAHVVGEYTKLHEQVEADLNKVASLESMKLLRVIADMFDNWPVTIYRGGKIPAGGLFAVPMEIFVHDRGDEGSNGKTVLQTINSVLAGDYFAAIDDGMLDKRRQALRWGACQHSLLYV